MPTTWYDGVITQIQYLTESTRLIKVRVQGVDKFEYLPGQFITCDLPIGDKRTQRWRSYSIASAPNGYIDIELCIVLYREGLGTPYIFSLGLGDTFKLKGPGGGFILPANLDQNIVMISTGTGVAPFRSMIKHVIENGIEYKQIHLIFGTRKETDILFLEEWKALAATDHRFKFDIALSRQSLPGFCNGYVHEIYKKAYANLNNDNTYFMLCGWSGMIDQACVHLIKDMNVSPSNIKFELYG
jgi:NAD(P)H-flavin reductase